MYFLIINFKFEEPSKPQVVMEENQIKFFEDLNEVDQYISENGIDDHYFIGLYDEEFTDIESLKYFKDVPSR